MTLTDDTGMTNSFLGSAAAVIDYIRDTTKSKLDDNSLDANWDRIDAALWEQGDDAFTTPAMETHFLAMAMHGNAFAQIDFPAISGTRMALVSPGQLCYVPAGQPCSVSFEGRFRTLHVMIPQRVFDETLQDAVRGDPALLHPVGFASEVDLEVVRAVLKLHVLLLDPTAHDALAADELAFGIARRLSELTLPQLGPDNDANSMSQIQMRQALEFIEANVFRDYSLGDIASFVGTTERRFSLAFEAEAGQALSVFRAERRVDFVRDWVAAGEKSTPAAQIAQRAGYASVEQLDRAFRSVLGVGFENYRMDRLS